MSVSCETDSGSFRATDERDINQFRKGYEGIGILILMNPSPLLPFIKRLARQLKLTRWAADATGTGAIHGDNLGADWFVGGTRGD